MLNQLQEIELLDVEDINSQGESNDAPKFEITDLDSLNWVFRKMAALKAKQKDIQQLADVERQRISDWEKGELSSITSSLEFFESKVAVFHMEELAKDPKAKTISTPYGKSKTRKSKEAPEKENEDVILQHVIESGLDDFIKQSVKWGDLKKSLKIAEISGEKVVVDENGQIVPGVTIKPESISYSVEV
ncbi:host-nuclease inhibitor Gam family protein [Sutcliffiella rhizosphaerae]|uniref:Host-nuclease inhibitor protein Gam n=1 Tax=Sutcliffiella rhizosphaerae TaxID=2880967 RepID=A0ABN8A703_9BACI|nr:host-nuclease inhibitor Gam family protein [Sutcliffiella rhizosphaerae]CAG9620848.1 hypothetical protein BACCIP111883_01619 [Sutcliffiella rhizosphaerae]